MNKAGNAILLMVLLVLTGCVSRQQADTKLAAACQAAVEVFLPEGTTVKTIKDKKYKNGVHGNGYRDVTLSAVETDGWADIDKTYNCTFEERFGPLGLNYTASFYGLSFDDRSYGKIGDDNTIKGEIADIVKINQAVESAMQ